MDTLEISGMEKLVKMTGVETSNMSTPVDGIPCPPPILRRSSQISPWEFILPKREPVDHEERNDSGINSENDCHSSSPGSDHSNVLSSSPGINQMIPPLLDYYSTPLVKMEQSTSVTCEEYNSRPTHHLYDNEHNVLSPPNSEPLASPNSLHNVTLTSSNVEVKREINYSETVLTPCASPDEQATPQTSSSSEHNKDDPFRGLQMTFEKNGLPLPLSVFGHKNKPSNEPTHNKPKINSHGKIKKLKCKQCSFECLIKAEFWEHTKEHIKVEKRLTCPKCPFVTEFKHHLDYHIRNHYGDKPYKCNQCSYECVNKSMLNSHLKSHSNVHQYRCADCHYKTKYCHSLKKHLRTENHKPAMVLNPDGTPNPVPIIDIYGSRRGPKVKTQEHMPLAMGERSPPPDAGVPFPLNQFPPNLQLPFPAFPFFTGFPGVLTNPLILENLEKYMREAQGSSLAQEETSQHMETEAEVLDLSKPEGQKNRRKGQAIKYAPEQDVSDDEGLTTMFSNVEVVVDAEAEASTSANEASSDAKEDMSGNKGKGDYKCRFCDIYFGDSVLYTMHMGYHGYSNPFACNMCGEVCEDKISFFVHIARISHS